jgi:hypothetical protein
MKHLILDTIRNYGSFRTKFIVPMALVMTSVGFSQEVSTKTFQAALVSAADLAQAPRPGIASDFALLTMVSKTDTGISVLVEASYNPKLVPAGGIIEIPLECGVDKTCMVSLSDTGENGDRQARDGLFTGKSELSLEQLVRLTEASRKSAGKIVPVFKGRQVASKMALQAFPLDELLGGKQIAVVREPEALKDARVAGRSFFLCVGDPNAYDYGKTNVITNLSVIEDPSRTWDPCPAPSGTGTPMGAWTFGKLMADMAGSTDPSDFVLAWLRKWGVAQTINNESVPAIAGMQSQVIAPWLTKSQTTLGVPNKLDLSIAPFRLLAIINRVDLRGSFGYNGGAPEDPCNPGAPGGELRFVFCCNNNVNCVPFTAPRRLLVILEYAVPFNTCGQVRAWAQQWAALNTSTNYNNDLQNLTDQIVTAGAGGMRPNGSLISQVRTNDFLDASTWNLREFRIFNSGSDAGHLREVTVVQTPANSKNNTAVLKDWVFNNLASLTTNPSSHSIPLFTAGKEFLGGQSPMAGAPITTPVVATIIDPPPAQPYIALPAIPAAGPGSREYNNSFWRTPTSPLPILVATNPQHVLARFNLSLNTCAGCHARETSTPFAQIDCRNRLQATPLSHFLTQKLTVTDPVFNTLAAPVVHQFDEKSRRVADLNATANCPCLFLGLFNVEVAEVH